jgi:hypothetical protein
MGDIRIQRGRITLSGTALSGSATLDYGVDTSKAFVRVIDMLGGRPGRDLRPRPRLRRGRAQHHDRRTPDADQLGGPGRPCHARRRRRDLWREGVWQLFKRPSSCPGFVREFSNGNSEG